MLFLVSLCASAASVNAEVSLPRLKVEGNRLVKADETPVTLRGVSLCSLEWHKPLEQIDTVTISPEKWKVNVLRLPIQVREWDRIGPQSYIKAYLDPAVAACKKNNIYCILDWHEIAAWNDPKVAKKLQDFWSLVAPRYASYPNIMYEVFNEPTDPGDDTRENWLAFRDKMQGWVDGIRKSAPNTVLLIGSPRWSQLPDYAATDPLEGKNLAYVMHLYPNLKSNQWDKLMGNASKTVPIFVSEWGWTSAENAFWVIKGTKEEYAQPLREYMDARPSINWTAWSYDPACGPAMLGNDKEMGIFVKQWLSEVN